MAPDSAQRRLAAILSADVVGYSRLMAEDETGTARRISLLREEVAALVRDHDGRLVDFTGDNFLAEFSAVLESVRCAIELQRAERRREAALPEPERMRLRMGIHLGDVGVDGERIYGEGVNVAARLEGLADPGGICVSAAVREQVRARLPVEFEDLGERELKNIPEPIRVFRARLYGEPPRRGSRAIRNAALTLGATVVLVAVGAWATWPLALGWLLDLSGLGSLPEDPPLPDRPSIVVLPFENLSGDPDQEYFSDGFTEEITTELSRSPLLFVISRSSAFTYKGQRVKLADVGRELGVRYVLEGSVRRARDRVRITAQLIDARTDTHMWSESYDRDLSDVFAVQSEISSQIQAALLDTIHAAELERVLVRPRIDPRASDLLAQAIFLTRRFRKEDNAEARRLVERVLEIEPGYAAALADLSIVYFLDAMMLWDLDPTLLERAEDLARRAIELDPDGIEGRIALANLSLLRGDAALAIEQAEIVVEQVPNLDAAHMLLGMANARQGNLRRAFESLRLATRLNPRAPNQALALLNFVAGRTERAVEMWEELRAWNPDLINARLGLAAVYAGDRRDAEAREIVREILRVNPDVTTDVAFERFPLSLVQEARRGALREGLHRAGLP